MLRSPGRILAFALDELTADDVLYAGGIGLRYQLLSRFPLNDRVDAAYGRDGTYVYFSLGEAF